MLDARILLLVSLLGLATSVSPTEPQTHPSQSPALSRADSLPLAEAAARKQGYDPSKFVLSTFGAEVTEDGKEWLFGYECPGIHPPGCNFLVVINRGTGEARVIPGE